MTRPCGWFQSGSQGNHPGAPARWLGAPPLLTQEGNVRAFMMCFNIAGEFMDIKTVLQEVIVAHKKWLDTDGREGKRAELKNALLQEADLHDLNLQEADMEGAKLSVADLMRTNLRRANLKGADLWMADMKDTNLQGADLQGANLADVTSLTQPQVDSAITDAATVLPAGLKRG